MSKLSDSDSVRTFYVRQKLEVVFNTLTDFKPENRFEKKGGATELRRHNNTTAKKAREFWIC